MRCGFLTAPHSCRGGLKRRSWKQRLPNWRTARARFPRPTGWVTQPLRSQQVSRRFSYALRIIPQKIQKGKGGNLCYIGKWYRNQSKESAGPYRLSACLPAHGVRRRHLGVGRSYLCAASMCQQRSIQRGRLRVPSVLPDRQRDVPIPAA